jgi:hypothetical protein
MNKFFSHPLARRMLWVVFAILFYYSGLNFTIWLLEPENFAGGVDWVWVALFPVLLPAFFLVNRHLGCASGRCASGECKIPQKPGYPSDRMRVALHTCCTLD